MDVKKIRLFNAQYLGNMKFSRQHLADLLEYADTNYLNQLVNGNCDIGDNTARRFEKKLNLGHGWMDHPHPSLWVQAGIEHTEFASDLLDGMSASDIAAFIEEALSILKSRQ